MRRDAQRNQELVIDAAREVLSEYGTEASMELVASRAGVGVGTVYRRFPNKEALIEELVRLLLAELNDAARAALARGDGTGLESFLRVLGQVCADHRGYADKLTGQNKADYARELYELMAQLLTQAQEFDRIGAHVTIGDVRAVSWALRAIIQTTGAIAPDAWERHLDIHLAGLRAVEVPSIRPALTTEQLALITGAK